MYTIIILINISLERITLLYSKGIQERQQSKAIHIESLKPVVKPDPFYMIKREISAFHSISESFNQHQQFQMLEHRKGQCNLFVPLLHQILLPTMRGIPDAQRYNGAIMQLGCPIQVGNFKFPTRISDRCERYISSGES